MHSTVEDERHRVSHRTNPKINPNLLRAIAVLVCAAGVLWIWRSSMPPTPSLLARSAAPVTVADWHDDAWYWLESAGGPGSRILRAAGSSTVAIVSEGLITSYTAGQGHIAWIVGKGDKWRVNLEGIDGTGKSAIWTGNREPHGLCVADSKLYWLEDTLPFLPNSSPMPPLDSRVQVVAAPLSGGSPAVVGEIMERHGSQVLGVHDGSIFVMATRQGLQDATVLYRCPVAGGMARRIAAETGDHRALLTHNGELYWTGPSRESAQPQRSICIRRIAGAGRTEWLQDWLPYGGRFYESTHGVYYVGGGSGVPFAFPVGGSNPLPQTAPIPDGYATVAVGNNEMLVRQIATGDNSLYRISLQ